MPKTKEKTEILFVEPDAFLAELLKIKLELDGLGVTVVPTVKRMQEKLKKKDFALIMIEMSVGAEEALQQIKSSTKTKHIPVIVSAPYATREDVSRASAAGAKEFVITSQCTPTELTQRIKLCVKDSH